MKICDNVFRAFGFYVGVLLVFASQSSSADSVDLIDANGVNAVLSLQLERQVRVPVAGMVPVAPLLQGPTMTIANTDTLGVVSVGVDKQERNVGYRLVVAMVTVTPASLDAREVLEQCSVGFSEDVKGLRTLLDTYVQSSSDMLLSLPLDIGARNAEMKRRQEAAKASTQSAFALFQQAVVQKLAVCHAVRNMEIPLVSIGLITTPCVIDSSECPRNKAAGLERFQKIANLYEGANLLGKIKEWNMVATNGELGTFKPNLTLPTLQTAINLSSSDVQDSLARRVKQLREKAEKAEVVKSELIQPVAAALAGLSRNDIVRMADVLSSPNAAVRMAWGATDQALKVSDELARVRIQECTKFQGKTKVADIATCAGYKLIDDKSLDECLNGELCRPQFGEKMNLNVALLAERLDVKKLAVSADLPRIIDTKLQFSDYQKAAFNCADKNRSDPASMVTCLSQAQFPDQKVKDVLGCARTMVGTKKDSVITDCLDIALGANTKEAQIAQCLLKAGEDGTQRMMCVAQKAMDPATAKALNCAMTVTSVNQISKCVSDPNVAKLLKAKECIDAGGGDRMKITLCMARGNADPKTLDAINCMVSSRGDYKKGLTCVALQNVSGDVGLIIRCAASSGGDPRGTAICAVTPGLTPEQQIALSCGVTASTGPGYAACVGGQLTLKEFTNCKDHKFAEGDCFGDSNELRKFSKNVLGQEIGSNSVVANVINVNLKVFNGTIAFTESLLRDGSKAVEKLNKELTAGLSQAGRAAEDLAAAAGGLAAGLNVAAPNITVGSTGVKVNTPIAGIEIGDGKLSADVGGFHVSFSL
jgi:hypothetical protein